MSGPVEAQLRDALELLAADGGKQEIYLREIGTWPSLDELALSLDDVDEAAGASLSAVARERVRTLAGRLDEMSGSDHVRLWQSDALYGPEWAEVRSLASDALSVLG